MMDNKTMSFLTHYYLKEAKLSAFRQFANLFSKEKKININLIKDLIFFKEVNEKAFDEVNSELSDSYVQHKKLNKIKKATKYSGDKILTRASRRKQMDIEAGEQIINVFKANINGGLELIEPYENVVAAAAYETGRNFLHYGYIVAIAVERESNIIYYIGADKLGMRFFKNMFGTNMDIYFATNITKKYKSQDDYEQEIKIPIKQIAYVKIIDLEKIKKEIFEDIKNTWGTNKQIGNNFKNKISNIEKSQITVKSKSLIGYKYKLYPSEQTIGVFYGGATPSSLIIIFYDGKNTVNEAKKSRMFDDLNSIENADDKIFKNVNYIKDFDKI